MSVRKRILPRTGETRWQVDYRDHGGVRRAKQFRVKADATSFETKTRAELVAGTHVADSASVTVAEAGDIWLAACEASGLEGSTLRQYGNHLKHHIKPLLGTTRLSRLTAPIAQDFVDRLGKDRNRPTVVKVTTSLKSIVSEAVRRGLAATNAVREVRVPGSSRDDVPTEFPTQDEIKLLLGRATGDLRPFIHTSIFTGLRPSEIRGLLWADIDFKDAEIRVRQRADRFNKLGKLKSKAAHRDLPIGPHLLSVLREWKVAQPVEQRGNGLVFPDASGAVEDHTAMYRRFGALQIANGIVAASVGSEPPKQKFGLHGMRHACASLLIAQGWLPKRIQVFMGHSSIGLTFDTYGHLFKDALGDQKAMAKLESGLIG